PPAPRPLPHRDSTVTSEGFLGCHYRDVLSAAPDVGTEVHVLRAVPRLEGGAASRDLRGGEPLKTEALKHLAGRAAVPDDNLGVHEDFRLRGHRPHLGLVANPDSGTTAGGARARLSVQQGGVAG